MSDQQRRQDNQPELQQHDWQVVRPPCVQAIFRFKIRFLEFLLDVLWFGHRNDGDIKLGLRRIIPKDIGHLYMLRHRQPISPEVDIVAIVLVAPGALMGKCTFGPQWALITIIVIGSSQHAIMPYKKSDIWSKRYHTTAGSKLSTSRWVQGEMVQSPQDLPSNAEAMFNSF